MRCDFEKNVLSSTPEEAVNPLYKQWHLEEDDFFRGMPDVKKEFILLSAKMQIPKNQLVFYEGERCDSTFYIESGKVKTFRLTSCGKECTFFIRSAGEIFGLSEVIGLNVRKANAQALSACTLFELKKSEFEGLVGRHVMFAKRVMENQARRIRYLCDQVENLMVSDVSNRLLKLFIYLSYQKLSESSYEEPVSVPIILTQEQIASMTGSCQQTVSEALKKLKEDGLIKISRREIILLEPHKILKCLEMI